ncbi:MAG: hypothetical protein AB8G14_00940 [Ilumatobacter sp.]
MITSRDEKSPTSAGHRWKVKVGAIVAAAVMLGACGPSSSDAIEIDAAIDGISLDAADASDPLPLSTEESELVLTMTNVSNAPQAIRYLRLEGEMVGLTFLTYTTRVGVELAPGEQRTVAVPLDFFDIDTQAHGFLRSKLALYAPGADRELLGTDEFAVDVRGSVTSTMALFAVLLLIVTAASLFVNLTGLARRTLPPNRFRRALRFAASGLGVGLLLTVAFSVLRVFPLPSVAWWPLLVIPTAVAFAAGYVAPGVDDEIDEEELEDLRELDDTLAAVAAAVSDDD